MYQVNQCDRNAVIREGDYTVRDNVQPDDLLVPQVASAVGQKSDEINPLKSCNAGRPREKTHSSSGRNVRQLTIVRNVRELEHVRS